MAAECYGLPHVSAYDQNIYRKPSGSEGSIEHGILFSGAISNVTNVFELQKFQKDFPFYGCAVVYLMGVFGKIWPCYKWTPLHFEYIVENK